MRVSVCVRDDHIASISEWEVPGFKCAPVPLIMDNRDSRCVVSGLWSVRAVAPSARTHQRTHHTPNRERERARARDSAVNRRIGVGVGGFVSAVRVCSVRTNGTKPNCPGFFPTKCSSTSHVIWKYQRQRFQRNILVSMCHIFRTRSSETDAHSCANCAHCWHNHWYLRKP